MVWFDSINSWERRAKRAPAVPAKQVRKTPKRDTVWTEEKIAYLRMAWERGDTGDQIAAATGLSKSAVISKKTRMGLALRPPRNIAAGTTAEIAAIEAKFAAGKTINMVAGELGRSWHFVSNYWPGNKP